MLKNAILVFGEKATWILAVLLLIKNSTSSYNVFEVVVSFAAITVALFEFGLKNYFLRMISLGELYVADRAFGAVMLLSVFFLIIAGLSFSKTNYVISVAAARSGYILLTTFCVLRARFTGNKFGILFVLIGINIGRILGVYFFNQEILFFFLIDIIALAILIAFNLQRKIDFKFAMMTVLESIRYSRWLIPNAIAMGLIANIVKIYSYFNLIDERALLQVNIYSRISMAILIGNTAMYLHVIKDLTRAVELGSKAAIVNALTKQMTPVVLIALLSIGLISSDLPKLIGVDNNYKTVGVLYICYVLLWTFLVFFETVEVLRNRTKIYSVMNISFAIITLALVGSQWLSVTQLLLFIAGGFLVLVATNCRRCFNFQKIKTLAL